MTPSEIEALEDQIVATQNEIDDIERWYGDHNGDLEPKHKRQVAKLQNKLDRLHRELSE